MPAVRKKPSKDLTETVMKEFHHLCALCGKRSPQLHHIDENRDNNTELNLIPLCPNHHFLDAHSPTSIVSVEKLQLFRKFKDPAIFLPQFQPLLSRMMFLLALGQDVAKRPDLLPSVYDLIEFMSHLQLGSYYAKRVAKVLALEMLEPHDSGRDKNGNPDYLASAVAVLERAICQKQFPEDVKAAREKAVSLIVESLRYQQWKNVKPYGDGFTGAST